MTISEGGAQAGADGAERPQWDWSTKDGRKALDTGILHVLFAADEDKAPDVSRASVAWWIGIGNEEAALRAVGRACGRLVTAGLALEKGERGKRTYRISAKGKRMAEKGGGR